MLTKIETFNLIEGFLKDSGALASEDEASEVADALTEILDEEGFFVPRDEDVEL